MSDDRIRAELEALERSAPADLPPRPSFETERRQRRAWIPVVAIAALALVVGASFPVWLGLIRPLVSTGPSATGGPSNSGAPTVSAEPGRPLAFHVVAFPDPGAALFSITNIDGRLILTGSLESAPIAWYSDDAGQTWKRSVVVDDIKARIVPSQGVMGEVAGSRQHLAALGSYATSPSDAEFEPTIRTSDDFGQTWRAAAIGETPRGIDSIVWDGSRFLAFGGRTATNGVDVVSNSVAVWASSDGVAWAQVAGPEPFGSSVALLGVAEADGLTGVLVADGTGAHLWLSHDGSAWSQVPPGELAGAPEAVAADGADLIVASRSAQRGDRQLLRTRDGRTWTSQALALEAPTPDIPFAISSITAGGSGVLLGGLDLTLAPVPIPLAWYVPTGSSAGAFVDIGFVDAAAVDEAIIGAGSCGPTADCATNLVYGLPAGQAPPTPTVETAATSSPAALPAFDVVLSAGDDATIRYVQRLVIGGGRFVAAVDTIHSTYVPPVGPGDYSGAIYLGDLDGNWELVDTGDTFAHTQLTEVLDPVGAPMVLYGLTSSEPGSTRTEVWTSEDGRTWNSATPPPGVTGYSRVAAGPGGFVAATTRVDPDAGTYSLELYLSTDGLDWQRTYRHAESSALTIAAVGAGPEGFVVTGNRQGDAAGAFSLASSDGRTWLPSPDASFPSGTTLTALAPIGGDWVASGFARDGTIPVWSSANGLDWEKVAAIPDPGGSAFPGDPAGASTFGYASHLVSAGGRLFLSGAREAEGTNTRPAAVWTSTDGIAWSLMDIGRDAEIRSVTGVQEWFLLGGRLGDAQGDATIWRVRADWFD